MRAPQTVWESCADDERWLEQQVAMVDEIMREAFAAGFAAGVASAAAAVEDHATQLASNQALRLPESVANGLRARLVMVRELPQQMSVLAHAWREACARGGPAPLALLPGGAR